MLTRVTPVATLNADTASWQITQWDSDCW